MKKLMTTCIAAILISALVACASQKGTTDQDEIDKAPVDKSAQETEKDEEETIQETEETTAPVEEEETPAEVNDNTFEKYISMIGKTKEDAIEIYGEDTRVIDEGGLEFVTTGLRMWFDNDGKIIRQIFTQNADIDFNGAKVGDKVQQFVDAFGTPVAEDTGSAYSNFDYEGIVVHIQYDANSGQVIAVYVMDEWQ